MDLSMEEEKGRMEMSISAGGGAPSSSRWNPTKEQISVLEGLYMQGIRTPSAEQIQQITSKLRAYGHIEGKNVFYWFQNHKARQRQKQKQESLLYFNRLFHKATPILPPPPPTYANALCSPYFIPNSAVGFYAQCAKVPLPGTSPRITRRSSSVEKSAEKSNKNGSDDYECCLNTVTVAPHDDEEIDSIGRETLQLFPLHPTGILDEPGNAAITSAPASVTCNEDFSISSDEQVIRETELFNFFTGERQ